MNFSEQQLLHYVFVFFWPLCRISALIIVMPFIGNSMIPARIRLMFSLLLTIVISPTVQHIPTVDPISIAGLMVVCQQILIGLTLGFIFQLVLQAFIMGGQLVAMQSGLGYASLVDPVSGGSVPLISQLYSIATGLLFFSLNGHLHVISILAESFVRFPIASDTFHASNFMSLINFASWSFSGAVLLALPILISLLVVNIALGILTRAAPALNIYSIGFPITLTIGLLLVYLNFSQYTQHFDFMMLRGFELFDAIAGNKA